MDDILLQNRMRLPVTTGFPAVSTKVRQQETQTQDPSSFQQILEEKSSAQGLSFSKHAAGRVAERGIELSSYGLERLNNGLRLAKAKGLDDALLLMDGSAFIISAKNNMVITALNPGELKEKVFTNIDGTVIL